MTDGGSNTFAVKVTEVDGTAVKAFEITNFGAAVPNAQVVSGGTPSPSSGRSGFTCTVTRPDIPYEKVKIFKKQGPHMLAFNYSTSDADFSTSFSWCSADNLDLWIGAANNTAGNLQIREANSEIKCVAQLGNSLAVYTQTQMFLVSYVGLPNIFGYKKAFDSGVGAVSPNSVVSVGRKNYGLSRDGFFVTDGASIQPIGRQSSINDFFKSKATLSSLGKVYAFDNSADNEVTWVVPIESKNISKEIYYNYKTNQWGIRSSNVTAFLARGIFDEPLSGDAEGKFYFEGTVPNISNTLTFAETKAHDFNDADRIKEITALRVGKEGEGNPSIKLAATNTIDETPVYTSEFIADTTFKSFPVRIAGRYIHLKIEGTSTSDTWQITDMVIQGRFEGER